MFMQKTLSAALLSAALLAPHAFAQATITSGAKVQAGVYDIQASHTRVLWSTSHMGFTTWYGEFTKTSGTLSLDPAHPAASQLSIKIDTASVSTSNAMLDGELTGAKWFDAAQYPEIDFVSTKVKQTGANTAQVTGNLTFHGVTKPVTLNVKFNGAGVNPIDKKYTAGFEVSGEIVRSDYGMKIDAPLIGDDVKLIISAAFEHE
jgi:polyisoprenoid-binding protein YceI